MSTESQPKPIGETLVKLRASVDIVAADRILWAEDFLGDVYQIEAAGFQDHPKIKPVLKRMGEVLGGDIEEGIQGIWYLHRSGNHSRVVESISALRLLGLDNDKHPRVQKVIHELGLAASPAADAVATISGEPVISGAPIRVDLPAPVSATPRLGDEREAPVGASADEALVPERTLAGNWTLALPNRDINIGRDNGNDLVTEDTQVSRRHARIVHLKEGDKDNYLLEDLQSRNGTQIKGEEIVKRQLQSGDTIKIGQTEFFFLQEEGKPGRLVYMDGTVKIGEKNPTQGVSSDLTITSENIAARERSESPDRDSRASTDSILAEAGMVDEGVVEKTPGSKVAPENSASGLDPNLLAEWNDLFEGQVELDEDAATRLQEALAEASGGRVPAARVEDSVDPEVQKVRELKEKEDRLIDEIIKSGECLITTWSLANYAGTIDDGQNSINPLGKYLSAGWNSENTPKYWRGVATMNLDRSLRDSYQKVTPFRNHRINELVIMQPATKEAGVQSVTVGEAIQSDSQEKAGILEYFATGVIDELIGQMKQHYLDRPGNFLNVKFIAPEQVIQQVAPMLQEDPAFIRKLILKMIPLRYPRVFVEEVLKEGYSLPPYRKWEGQAQPKMYFVDALSNAEDRQNLGKLGFDQSKVIEFNTKVVDGYRFAVVKSKNGSEVKPTVPLAPVVVGPTEIPDNSSPAQPVEIPTETQLNELVQAGKLDEAAEGYRRLLRATANPAPRVIDTLSQLIQSYPDNGNLYRALGEAYMRAGRPLKAVEAFNQAVAKRARTPRTDQS